MTPNIPRICTEVSTIGDLLCRGAAHVPARSALTFPDTHLTYGQLYDDAAAMARGLIGLGVAPGSHVGLFMPNCPDFARAFFAITLAGGVVVPLNTRHKAVELGYIISNADLVVIITSDEGGGYVDLPRQLTEALPGLDAASSGQKLNLQCAPRLRHVVQLAGTCRPGMTDRTALEDAAAVVPVALVEKSRRCVRVRDPGLILYTSGTTAHPKGCMLSHEAVTRGPVERARYRLSTGGHEVTWGAGPLFHIGSLAPFIGSMGAMGTYLTDRFFDPGRAIALMVREGVTLAWPWFSAIVQGIIDHPDFQAEKFDRLRHLFMIAPATLVDRVQTLFPKAEILQACGMTETAGVFALSDPDESRESRNTTQGRVSPGMEVRIVDPETGLDQPPDVMGEIWVRGFSVMDGYYGDPEKTAAVLSPEGWLRTGDLYTRSAGGSVVFNGRLKDMLKVGGENVATMEVEAFLCSHPDVKLAEVVGKADPRLDEVPVAFIELRNGAAISADDLIGFCRGRIASYKVPREVHFVMAHEWPMSATKVDKRALRAWLRTS